MYEDLIRALRCTKNENNDCQTCKYQMLCEGRYDYCDQEQLELDAAVALKTLEAENVALRDLGEEVSSDCAAKDGELADLRKQLARVTAERDKLLDRTHEAQVERDCARAERDAAIKDIGLAASGQCCKICARDCIGHEEMTACSAFQWRGLKKEDDDD